MNWSIRLLIAACLLSFGFSASAQCGGKERWAVKDGTDPEATSVDLSNPIPKTVAELVNLHRPKIPRDNTTRIVPDETRIYKVHAYLVKWKKEAGDGGDSDYHLVLSDETRKYTLAKARKPSEHSFVGEIPDPDCLAGRHGDFGSESPFLPASDTAPLSIRTARKALEEKFPDADLDGNWNNARGIPVDVIGVGFFDVAHGQAGLAKNHIELHPILAISFEDQVHASIASPGANIRANTGGRHAARNRRVSVGANEK